MVPAMNIFLVTGCGGEFLGSSGSLRYPLSGDNYGENEDCTWIIRSTGPLSITFTEFDTYRGEDYLYIR